MLTNAPSLEERVLYLEEIVARLEADRQAREEADSQQTDFFAEAAAAIRAGNHAA